MTTWTAPCTPTPVHATVAIPGSKSLTNRTLILAAVAAAQGQGQSTIAGALRSRDTDLMIGALRTLGLTVEGDAAALTVSGSLAPSAGATVDCGLAGTVLRFVPALAALGPVDVVFDGDEQARARPIAPLLGALRSLGVDIDNDSMPFRVAGTGGVKGGTVEIDASASSQFVSGLLLCGAAFEEGVTVVHTGDTLPSAPHIAMTTAMLRQAGVQVDDSTANQWHVAPGPVAARHWDVEPDLSGAAPFLAAAVVSGGIVRLTGWPSESLQPADTIVSLFEMLNATATQADTHLEINGTALYDGFDVDLRDIGELTPVVAVLAALATPGSVSQLRGIAHLRGHETDRLAALTAELNGLGGECEETADGLRITATQLHGGMWHTYADHRMAMAGALVGLRVAGVEIDDIATTAKTLPEFPHLWSDMLAGQDFDL
ncbi:3-phosphoshikimate 1-carboxyvinyltransferase [Mycolicibacterium mengxianglii]|uniref:3-phosphoshikimate 1-carboxyvinyltransferase n=1 Tax=Mycolicibacterium mengxianglii TaxID=2736649 RepID=UPI0018D1B0CB|nr:3-phosphoshikimate 1-carboxyvinyltransferase [Mycolicibacterium mengxianglii]